MPADAPPSPDLRARVRAALRPVRRTLLARRRLLAAGCAGVAVLAGLRAGADPPPDVVAVPVLVRDVGAGTVLGPDDLTTLDLAPGAVPAAVVADPVGRVAAAAIGRGEPVTATRLLGPGLADALPAGADATVVPVRFPDAATAALLRVGDELDLVAVDPQGGPPSQVTRGARVLALPRGGDTSDAQPGRVVVLGVATADVAGVADASVRLFLTWSYRR